MFEKNEPAFVYKKIEEYLEVDGHTIDDIAVLIVSAIAVSGALGKTISNNVLKIYYPELFASKEESEEKNA